MRLLRLFFGFLALSATSAATAAPARLAGLEQQLQAIAAADPDPDIGIAALDLLTGDYVAVHGDIAFPMASTVKVAVAANYLAQVEHGRRSLDTLIRGRVAADWIDRMLIYSDNYATDVLIRDLGGTAAVQAWLSQNNLSGLRIDRTIAQLLGDRRDLHDIRDSSTPRAMVQLLARIEQGKLLRADSRQYLLSVMARCKTGRNRLKGMLPAGTPIEHKTGTLAGYASDVGIITLPNGRRVAVAVFARSNIDRPRVIAEAGRAIYYGFGYGQPYAPSYAAGQPYAPAIRTPLPQALPQSPFAAPAVVSTPALPGGAGR